MSDTQFSSEERKAQAHLVALVDRQMTMGVPPELALGVLAGALGTVAAAQGLQRKDLPILYQWVEKAYGGALEGQAAREAENK